VPLNRAVGRAYIRETVPNAAPAPAPPAAPRPTHAGHGTTRHTPYGIRHTAYGIDTADRHWRALATGHGARRTAHGGSGSGDWRLAARGGWCGSKTKTGDLQIYYAAKRGAWWPVVGAGAGGR
jgi:hypothetical protein